MQAELITIGDEILIGQIVDTNSAWLAQQLHHIGIKVNQIKSISDTKEDIIEALENTKAELIIITGGLGPTNDDLTKKTLADYFKMPLVFHKDVLAHVEQLLVGKGVIVNELNREQAMLPEGALILPNANGTASGMWFKKDHQNFISLPGVPFEMKGIIENEVLKRLASQQNKAIVHKTIMTVGLPESMLAMKIKDWEDNLPENIKLAYLPRPGIVRLRLSATGENKELVTQAIEKATKDLLKLIPNEVFGYDDISLEEVIGHLLVDNNATISTAESCTGGHISALLTKVSGSSDYYKGSIISYSNEVKNEQLLIKNDILETEGAVSQKVVEQMAESVKSKLKTDFSIAVSGIAGPNGGTKEKPVGTTWIAVSGPQGTISKMFVFGEHRGRNVTRASLTALNMLRLFIKEKY